MVIISRFRVMGEDLTMFLINGIYLNLQSSTGSSKELLAKATTSLEE
jgi:hypothetical protein